MNSITRKLIFCLLICFLTGCKSNKQTTVESDLSSMIPVGPAFCADSAYQYCADQCDFGPRTMNSKAHDDCGEWIIRKFQQFGCTVTTQNATLKGYDGTALQSMNIIASYRPATADSTFNGNTILLCAHWDSRPWADNDPNPDNHHKPVMAANDGASGVAVMLEVARLLQQSDSVKVGVDFICFDAEDWGTPQWDTSSESDTWALGSQHWSRQYANSRQNTDNAGYAYGILLDMVGGQGARFYQEGYSLQYAQKIVRKVWNAAHTVGFSTYFPNETGATITDDHTPVNEVAGIPTIDIIPYYPDCQESNFGPTWHTVMDDMEHIDKNTLQAVGQTVIQVLFSE